jgi:hypothetical protein
LAKRSFYFSRHWRDARDRLPGLANRKPIRWWDEDDPTATEPTAPHEAALIDPVLDDAVLDPSVRGRLDSFVETFVIGWPRARLVRPVGFGMEPPFRRMRAPRAPVVEMRTAATRSFGFFVRAGVFVAHRLDLADNTHADPTLYARYGDDVLALLARMDPSEQDATTDVEMLTGDCDTDA